MASSTQIAQTRRLVYGGSTRSGSLSTDDVAWFFDNNANLYLAAAEAAQAEGINQAAKGDRKIGDFEIQYGDQGGVDFWMTLAKRLRMRGIRSVRPYSGGISKADKKNQRTNTDWDKPGSRLGQFDYPGTGSGASTF